MNVASADSRLAAALLDGLLLLLPVAVMFFVLAALGLPQRLDIDTPELFLTPEELDAVMARDFAESAALGRVAAATAVFGWAWVLSYLLIAHRRYGRTVGKHLQSLRLERRGGGRPGVAAILARSGVGLARVIGWAAIVAVLVGWIASLSGAPLDEWLDLAVRAGLGIDWDSIWLASAIAGGVLAFGVVELWQARTRRFVADVVSGTVVVREGYGTG